MFAYEIFERGSQLALGSALTFPAGVRVMQAARRAGLDADVRKVVAYRRDARRVQPSGALLASRMLRRDAWWKYDTN